MEKIIKVSLLLTFCISLSACGASWHHPTLPLPQDKLFNIALDECKRVVQAQELRVYSPSASETVGGIDSRGVVFKTRSDLTSIFVDWYMQHRLNAEAIEECLQNKGWVKYEN